MQLPKVAYLMSRFPKITETFILYEILELERQGVQVEVFPLIRERAAAMHAEAQAVVDRAHFSRPLSWAVLAAQAYWLARRPLAYAQAWWGALRGNIGSRGFLLRALVVVPQAALFAQECAARGVQHVHAHWATHPALAAYVINRLSGISYSFTAHAHDIYVDRTMLAEKIGAASFVVTISEYNRKLLSELYGPEAAAKIAVVHCGVDLDVFDPPARAARRGPLTLICVGSLLERKGQHVLVEACARLAAAGVSFQCLLVGEGEARPQIEALVRQHGLGGQVRLLGAQPRERVRELLAEADVMVLPSTSTVSGRQEGIPVALMEGMAMRLPVVSTAISGIPELVTDGVSGLLVPDREPAALAAALGRLAADPALRERLGASAREKVLQEFDLRRTTAALRELLLRGWGAPPAALLAKEQAL